MALGMLHKLVLEELISIGGFIEAASLIHSKVAKKSETRGDVSITAIGELIEAGFVISSPEGIKVTALGKETLAREGTLTKEDRDCIRRFDDATWSEDEWDTLMSGVFFILTVLNGVADGSKVGDEWGEFTNNIVKQEYGNPLWAAVMKRISGGVHYYFQKLERENEKRSATDVFDAIKSMLTKKLSAEDAQQFFAFLFLIGEQIVKAPGGKGQVTQLEVGMLNKLVSEYAV